MARQRRAVANVSIAVLAYLDVMELLGPISAMLIATAGLQLLVPIPLVVRLVRGRPNVSSVNPDRFSQIRAWSVRLAILGLMGFAGYGGFFARGKLLPF